jgi:alpha,alpha-trehalase
MSTPVEVTLAELFVDLHTSGLWSDEKYISDAVVQGEPTEVLSAYRAQKEHSDFDLRTFFDENFAPVEVKEIGFGYEQQRSPSEHIHALWPYLHRPADTNAKGRSSKVPLPHSYIVPGGRFQEVYYWDSYFTQLGLLLSGHHEWVLYLLLNFEHFILTYGHIPNGSRTYFLSRSQPPFFALMVDAYAQRSDDPNAVYERYKNALIKEYDFWSAEHRNVQGHTTYWDAENAPRIEMYRTDLEWVEHAKSHPSYFRNLRASCESGWDFSSRWMSDSQDLGTLRTLEIAPVDLASLLYFHEQLLHCITGEERYQHAAAKRKESLQMDFWTERGFEDIDLKTSEGTGVLSAASIFPLFVGAATEQQAEKMAAIVKEQLLQKGGITTTTITSGQQWDAPNGWAPLQWIAVQGLHRYGHAELAKTIAERWIETCDTIYHAKGKFVEKYNVYEPENLSKGGEYDVQDGFGWSNGVYLALENYLATY